jgi:hypothetical protein
MRVRLPLHIEYFPASVIGNILMDRVLWVQLPRRGKGRQDENWKSLVLPPPLCYSSINYERWDLTMCYEADFWADAYDDSKQDLRDLFKDIEAEKEEFSADEWAVVQWLISRVRSVADL